MSTELLALRDKIDEVDKSILSLINKRLALVAEVGDLKANTVFLFTILSVKQKC